MEYAKVGVFIQVSDCYAQMFITMTFVCNFPLDFAYVSHDTLNPINVILWSECVYMHIILQKHNRSVAALEVLNHWKEKLVSV